MNFDEHIFIIVIRTNSVAHKKYSKSIYSFGKLQTLKLLPLDDHYIRTIYKMNDFVHVIELTLNIII